MKTKRLFWAVPLSLLPIYLIGNIWVGRLDFVKFFSGPFPVVLFGNFSWSYFAYLALLLYLAKLLAWLTFLILVAFCVPPIRWMFGYLAGAALGLVVGLVLANLAFAFFLFLFLVHLVSIPWNEASALSIRYMGIIEMAGPLVISPSGIIGGLAWGAFYAHRQRKKSVRFLLPTLDLIVSLVERAWERFLQYMATNLPGTFMPKMVLVPVIALLYPLSWLLEKLINFSRNLTGHSIDQLVLEVSGEYNVYVGDWIGVFLTLLLSVLLVWLAWSLMAGKKPAWLFALGVAGTGGMAAIWGLGVRVVSWETRGFMESVHPATYLCLLSSLLAIVSLVFPPTSSYYKDKILWKPLLLRAGMGAAGVLAVLFLWVLWSFNFYNTHHP